MGLFSFLSGPTTKSDWDRRIIDLQNDLAREQANLANFKCELAHRKRTKGMNIDSVESCIASAQRQIASIKAEIANAKIQRKSAPAK